MDKKSIELAETTSIDAAEALVLSLLEKGVSVSEISFALASVATDLGLQMAPSAEHAFAVVADAISKTAATHGLTNSRAESGGDPKSQCDEAITIDPEIFGRTVH